MPTRYDPRSRMTGSPLGSIVSLWGRRGITRSVSTGTVSSALGSFTATIPSVVVANTRLTVSGPFDNSAATGSDTALIQSVLTNSTTVTFSRFASGATVANITYTACEYVPGILKSMQAGTVDMNGTGGAKTVTISTIDVARSILDFLGGYYGASTGMDAQYWVTAIITDPTTLTFTNKTNFAATQTNSYRVAEHF